MATLYSNELKAVVIAEDFKENPKNILKERCLTVQHFSYQCEHKRNSQGEYYGAQEPVILNFRVRIGSVHQVHTFYQNLASNGYYPYSFLFNPTFNQNQRLADYEDGMVVEGYVINVVETFNSSKSQAGEDEQVMLDVQLLVREITYVGRENQNNLRTIFIQ